MTSSLKIPTRFRQTSFAKTLAFRALGLTAIAISAADAQPAPDVIKPEIRSDEKSKTMSGEHDCHVDGNKGSYRFLQSIECPSTFLVEEGDAVLRPLTLADCHKLAGYYGSDIEEEKRHIGTMEWTLRDADNDNPITFWETPRNSVLLISDDQFVQGQPIMHTVPFRPAGEPEEFRTVTLYDCLYNL
jgi:hypothetical protein